MMTRWLGLTLIGFVVGIPYWGSARADSGDTNQTPGRLRLELDLVDGSHLIGLPKTASVPFRWSYAVIDIAWKDIRSITIGEGRDTATILMQNRDRLTGSFIFGNVGLTTPFGDVQIDTPHVTWINVVRPVSERMAGEERVVFIGGVRLEMAWIQPGEFKMGADDGRDDEKPVHRVRISKGFWMGKHEVTQELWEQVMGQNPSGFRGGRNPVDSVSWRDCQIFMGALNGMVPGSGFRLPTEAEWEYACRAGTTNAFYTGNADSDADDIAWHSGNSGGTTHPVGQKQANAWGLHDISGNVGEWCSDFWDDVYPSGLVLDPMGPSSGTGRILRGGSWNVSTVSCRSANRFNVGPSEVGRDAGLRVVVVDR
jgi:formylglycine-generating enzyme required for sulfatase activity